jgi:hypothetical protein
MTFNLHMGSFKALTMTLLLLAGLSMNVAGGPVLGKMIGARPSVADKAAPISVSAFGRFGSILAPVFDGNSANDEITVVKKAFLNDEAVDEVCGGTSVTFQYTVRNNVTGPPFTQPAQIYAVNIQDSDPALGDIDGTAGIVIQPGITVTYTKTKTIALGETSNSTVTVTGNYSSVGNPDDAVSAIDNWPVTGVPCEVEIEKTVNGAPPSGGQSFTFQIRTGASVNSSGTPIAVAVANAANGGNTGFAIALQANTPYQFCETQLLPGWTTSLSQVPGSFVPGSAGGNPDNGVVCINFTVAVGVPTVFTVNNSTPVGGPARTIGYWKSWSSCSGGKQDAVLDYVLSTFGTPPALPPDPIPTPLPPIVSGVTFGTLHINTCQEAVNILNKSTVGGVKKASHPAYNMAAQLLAVKLNIQANADRRCIDASVLAAEQLLIAIGFNGTGSPSYTASQGTQMNNLATYLDRYNNGDPDLCPLP